MNFEISKKKVCWFREWIEIDAKTEEEAIEKFKLGEYITCDSQIEEFGELLDEYLINENGDTIYEWNS